MLKEGEKLKASRYPEYSTQFLKYDGENIPFKDMFFDKIMTVNTLYFWTAPTNLLKEVYRVLKPNGLFTVVFADKDFMLNLPFTKFGFTLYTIDDFKALIAQTPFNLFSICTKKEMVETKLGDFQEREYHVIVLKK